MEQFNLHLSYSKKGAKEIGDFRLISLLGSTYKIISKYLDTRLKVVLPSVISQAQCVFLEGRFILDGTLCANGCMDSRIQGGIPRVICKVDVEKAYDHVSWGFFVGYVSEVWLWSEVVNLDSKMHGFGFFLCFA